MTWTLPNVLTTLRLLAAPGLVLLFLFVSRPLADWLALVFFAGAAVTDWFDGYLARAWKQESKFGAMLDPIADKVMVAIALLVLASFSTLVFSIVLPAVLILFREVFVSGLREFLGATAGTLTVTKLAKWKTTVQMVAIAALFFHGVMFHYAAEASVGMDPETITAVLEGGLDPAGLRWKSGLQDLARWIGIALLWLAAALTLITGWDYFRKALPHLKEGK
ncbi:CDP-diacylglycerol--glycerol-3-phosphate 3-phosphatidyltransferase [Aestuariibius sp. 2305UL40-4]|uniref:CDP-diacylglycerol--glycerol-3-phosphate 3-phosphatidyltransferase n=1 Tax=Aestuariibius violaceus TaxID=3234132 RepID=UPI00345EAF13